jgi:hypothetical protein
LYVSLLPFLVGFNGFRLPDLQFLLHREIETRFALKQILCMRFNLGLFLDNIGSVWIKKLKISFVAEPFLLCV